MSFVVLCAAGAAASGATARADAPAENQNSRLSGTTYHWSVSVPDAPHCEEQWTFAKDGVLIVVSGQEISTHTFSLTAAPGSSMLDLSRTRLTTNALPDCQNMVDATVGRVNHVYLQFLNGGGFFTCANTDTMSCYGVASPQAKREDTAP